MAQTYDVKLFQRDGVTMVRYPDGDEAVLADVMRYMNPGMEYDQATGEQMATPPPPAESATFTGTTVQDKPFGSIAGSMAEPYMTQAYDALTRTPVVDPNSYVPQSVQRINQAVGNVGGAGLSGLLGLIYGGAGLAGDVANATGMGGGQRLANDLAGMLDVAGVGPEARMVEVLSGAGAGRTIARTVAERANQRGPVPVMGSNFANLLGDTLPAPRNEAEAIARDILELRATGNVDAVTEEMMNAADPQYMYNYTPLPMDEASRMARAKQMGLGENVLHGTPYESFSQFKPSKFGALGPGVYVTKRPVTASDYARGWGEMDVRDTFIQDNQRYTVGGNILPIRVKGELQSFPDWTENKRNNMELDDLYGPTYKADEAASRMAEKQGFTGVQGRNENSVIFDPTNIRSRFARFDPMFSHLRNLSAGVAISPLAYGLLSDQYAREQRQ
jgi:hypothetical protein